MKTKVILSQQMASAIISAGQEEAQKNNWSVSIAVADDGGHLLALSRMDDCAPIAAYISQEKARTAALGRRETKGYEEMVNNGRTAFVTAPLLTSLEGGVPVVVDYSAAIFLIPICISFDTAEKRRYATYLILNRRFSFAF